MKTQYLNVCPLANPNINLPLTRDGRWRNFAQ